MNRDIRLSTSAPSNVKVKRLMRKLGRGGAWSWVNLLCYAGREKPDGRFASVDEIEVAVDWQPEDGDLVGALLETRLLDRDGDELVLHDWQEHNEYATHDRERSARQRLNAHTKHCPGPGHCGKDYCPASQPTAQPVAASGSASGKRAGASTSAPNPIPKPAPIPDPSPEPTKRLSDDVVSQRPGNGRGNENPPVSAEDVAFLRRVIRWAAPSIPDFDDGELATRIAIYGTDWIASLLTEKRTNFAKAATHKYLDKTLAEKKAEGWTAPEDARGYVALAMSRNLPAGGR